jgi:hypothetical protein
MVKRGGMKPIDPDVEEQRAETQFNYILGFIVLSLSLAVGMSWLAIWRFVSES